MDVNKWLEKVAYLKLVPMGGTPNEDIPKSWLSKFDDSYITFEGLEKDMKFLADREITEELTHGVGFSPKDNKWYGWSHRAIYGFTIGSTCEKGYCHYRGSSLKDQKDAAIQFWQDDCHLNVRCTGLVGKDKNEFFIIQWEYSNTTPNTKLRNKETSVHHHIKPFGKGEWIAKTMEDAKKMAIDFNKGVS